MLFVAALCAGFLDTLAGGGGLITIPALVLSGVPPLAALGTNKLQACVGVATSSFLLFRRGKLDWLALRGLMLTAFIGSAAGVASCAATPAKDVSNAPTRKSTESTLKRLRRTIATSSTADLSRAATARLWEPRSLLHL